MQDETKISESPHPCQLLRPSRHEKTIALNILTRPGTGRTATTTITTGTTTTTTMATEEVATADAPSLVDWLMAISEVVMASIMFIDFVARAVYWVHKWQARRADGPRGERQWWPAWLAGSKPAQMALEDLEGGGANVLPGGLDGPDDLPDAAGAVPPGVVAELAAAGHAVGRAWALAFAAGAAEALKEVQAATAAAAAATAAAPAAASGSGAGGGSGSGAGGGGSGVGGAGVGGGGSSSGSGAAKRRREQRKRKHQREVAAAAAAAAATAATAAVGAAAGPAGPAGPAGLAAGAGAAAADVAGVAGVAGTGRRGRRGSCPI